jgi:hypothetical protein
VGRAATVSATAAATVSSIFGGGTVLPQATSQRLINKPNVIPKACLIASPSLQYYDQIKKIFSIVPKVINKF